MEPEATPLATPVATPIPKLDAPSGGADFPWGDVLSALTIVLGLAYWWAGRRKVELTGYWKPLFELLDTALIGVGVVLLGWPIGPMLFVGTNILLALLKSIRLAMQHDDILTRAAAVSRLTKPELKALAKRLQRNHKIFRNLGPISTAKMIDHLSDTARNVPEIEAMAPPIAMLWIIDRPEMGKFVRDFDRLMRLWRIPASDTMKVADSVTKTAQISPMTIQDAIDSLIAVAGGFPGGDPHEPGTSECPVHGAD